MSKKNAFSVTDHIWVPKHEALSGEEAKQILEKYACTLDQLPQIKHDDPAIVNMKLAPGKIVKITRENGSVYYRVVV